MADLGPAEGDDQDHSQRTWVRVSDEGEHRLQRTPLQFVATGMLGGFDVTLGVLAMLMVGGALLGSVADTVAEMVAAVAFGLGLALISIGRSELFTENFLVPVVAVVRDRGTGSQVLRLWAFTFVGNAIGVGLISAVISGTGILESPERAAFARASVDVVLGAGAWQNFTSALLAGMVMTLFTWLLHATSNDMARVVLSLAIGFLLTAPPLVHVVVTGSELALAWLSGTAVAPGAAAQLLGIGLVGNFLGGVGFVTLGRSAQVLSWPSAD